MQRRDVMVTHEEQQQLWRRVRTLSPTGLTASGGTGTPLPVAAVCPSDAAVYSTSSQQTGAVLGLEHPGGSQENTPAVPSLAIGERDPDGLSDAQHLQCVVEELAKIGWEARPAPRGKPVVARLAAAAAADDPPQPTAASHQHPPPSPPPPPPPAESLVSAQPGPQVSPVIPVQAIPQQQFQPVPQQMPTVHVPGVPGPVILTAPPMWVQPMQPPMPMMFPQALRAAPAVVGSHAGFIQVASPAPIAGFQQAQVVTPEAIAVPVAHGTAIGAPAQKPYPTAPSPSAAQFGEAETGPVYPSAVSAPSRARDREGGSTRKEAYRGRGGRKLFVGQLPRAASYSDVYTLMSPFGEIEDLHVIRGRKTGEGTGSAFVIYSKRESAVRAIEVLDGRLTMPGVGHTLHVRVAEGEIEAGSDVKLFVGHVPMHITEAELRDYFWPFGSLHEVSVLRRSGRGGEVAAFVRFASRGSADRCIAALHKKVTVQGGRQPLSVQLALTDEEKRSRKGNASNRVKEQSSAE
eukprot:Hpha_TRINITY_DN15403_c1_g1::TRINITY_DN15403_c1_g1_i3::g.175735::m.175735/K13207/CUGBP, BRUNOL, CELF; CUG-BP- and ETR3-like factor